MVIIRDFPLMIVLAIALYLMARGFSHSGHGTIHRWGGGVLLVIFIAYQILVFHNAGVAVH